MNCTQPHCTGTIEDGYCDVCGMAAGKSTMASQRLSAMVTVRGSSVTTGTGSSPISDRSKGSRRSRSTSARSSRKQLGAGLVSIPDLPSTEPEQAILPNPHVPENKRFCASCNNPLRREQGFCSKCGQKFSFVPSLKPGDLILGQYEVKGAIAYGGLGWIYLGFDQSLSRYVVLKGLLNTEDASSAAVAVAERKFLAAVKHSNIVNVYNFVNHGSEGFIVMEYVGGQTLKQIRKTRGVLPVTEAIAYIHRILSAFAYLHAQGLVYCDFKPDNAMLEGNDVKLIDMGGVRRLDDLDGDIYGTVGYTAPEAGAGPTIVSDLFTIGRTLAVLLCDIQGFGSDHKYTLPSPQEEPLFAQQESLYRFLLKTTATNPDDRFQTADEMAEQLLGVLREIVARETSTPRPADSKVLGGDRLSFLVRNPLEPIVPDYRQLPEPILDATDPAANAILSALGGMDEEQRIKALEQVVDRFPNSTEAQLRLANSFIEAGHSAKAEPILDQVGEQDPWDWRVYWYRGRSQMATRKFKAAQASFDQIYFDLPGELGPKLALGLAAEQAGNLALATAMYQLVVCTDPSYGAAVFGLARCLDAQGDRAAAVKVLEAIPQTSSLFTQSRVTVSQMLISTDRAVPKMQELQAASTAIQAIALDSHDRHRLTQHVLETALTLLQKQSLAPNQSITLLGQPLEEVKLRLGLEKTFRALAHLTTGEEKIRLVDRANQIRPRSLF